MGSQLEWEGGEKKRGVPSDRLSRGRKRYRSVSRVCAASTKVSSESPHCPDELATPSARGDLLPLKERMVSQ